MAAPLPPSVVARMLGLGKTVASGYNVGTVPVRTAATGAGGAGISSALLGLGGAGAAGYGVGSLPAFDPAREEMTNWLETSGVGAQLAALLGDTPQTQVPPQAVAEEVGLPLPGLGEQAPFGFSYPGGGVSYKARPLPTVPDQDPIRAMLDAAAPKQVPDQPNSELMTILAGIAAGNVDPNTPIGTMLLNMGLGAMRGKAAYAGRTQAKAEEFGLREEEFKRARAGQEAQLTQQAFTNAMGIEGLAGEQEGRRMEAQRANAGMYTPSISGGYLLERSPGPGGQINATVRALPNPKLDALSQVMAQSEASNPETLFAALQAMDPAGMQEIIKTSGINNMAMVGQGFDQKTVDQMTKAQIVSHVKQKAPRAYQAAQQAVQQAVMQRLLLGQSAGQMLGQ